MGLSGEEFKELKEAMLSAFPKRVDLEIMLRISMEENLDEITNCDNINADIFYLIKWAESEGRLKELVNKACETKPGNEKLQAVIAKFKIVFSADYHQSLSDSNEQEITPKPFQELQAEVSATTQTTTFQPSPATYRTFLHLWGTEVPHFLSLDVPQQEPISDFKLPDGYQYLGKLEGLSTEHLYREKDGHIAIFVPAQPGFVRPFLIDKYTITNQQFCLFLNELIDNKIARVEPHRSSGVKRAVDEEGRTLVLDALDQWQRPYSPQRPWLYAGQPWGMTYENYTWQPVAESELLPATLISWWGARLYSLWAHQELSSFHDENANYLPTVRQWEIACVQDILTQRQRRYPWGETWQRDRVNYAGYWARCEVKNNADREQFWAKHADIYRQTRPLPVNTLDEGRSPIGCVQMLGNVWEWCADHHEVSTIKKTIKGGSCICFQDNCDAKYSTGRTVESSEYIGFRCCFRLA